MNTRWKKTVFCDIDGTLIKHPPTPSSALKALGMVLLEGTLEKLDEWDKKGYNIILTTGRKESMRSVVEKQLQEAGMYYDQLIMGIGGGPRVLINDLKPNIDEKMAVAINIKRDVGIANIKI